MCNALQKVLARSLRWMILVQLYKFRKKMTIQRGSVRVLMPHLGRTGVKGTLAALHHFEFENMFITVSTALLSYASSF